LNRRKNALSQLTVLAPLGLALLTLVACETAVRVRKSKGKPAVKK
jgi:hypothetical protein